MDFESQAHAPGSTFSDVTLLAKVGRSRNIHACLCRSVAVEPQKGNDVEVRIGLVNTAREISLETSQTPAEIEKLVSDALASFWDKGENSVPTVLKLTDDKGKLYLIAAMNIAYVEIGSDKSRAVGFVN